MFRSLWSRWLKPLSRSVRPARAPRRRSCRPQLECLEDRVTPAMPSTVISVGPTVTNLISAIQAADTISGGAVLQLTPGAVYTLTGPANGGGTATPEQNNWYGP